jgi:hypothetical protein
MAALAMDHGSALDPGLCGALNREGHPCGNIAGKGTDHVGYGKCRSHGGSTPSGKTRGARLKALAELGPMGGEVDVNPLDALLYTVRRGSGLAALYRLQAEACAADGKDAAMYADLEAKALADLARWAKMAIDAGVAERMVRIAEGTGERLASALEEALEGVELPPGQRQVVVQRFAASLSRLEREQPAITAKAETV